MRRVNSAVVEIALFVQLLLPNSLGSALVSQETTPQQGDTGLELLHQCNDAMRFHDAGLNTQEYMYGMTCLGYLNGFLDGYMVTESESKRRFHLSSPLMCLPSDGIANEQGVRIVVKWLGDHPELLHEREGVLVMIAFGSAFPCK